MQSRFLIIFQVYDCKAALNTRSSFLYYDLSPLVLTNSTWLANDAREGGKYTYNINLCRNNVVPAPGCNQFSGSCQVVNNASSYNLGFPANLQINPNTSQPYLLYQGGTPCRNGYNRSTLIQFSCAKDENGVQLSGVYVCYYLVFYLD